MPVNGRRQNGGGRHNFVGRPKPLLIYTGLLGDTDRPARHRDTHRGLYLYALTWQDAWTVDQHRSFWTGCLHLCPRGEPGRRQHRDDLAAAAGWLRALGVVDSSIINMLREATGPNGPNADTLRKYETLDALEALRARADSTAPPLPRVYVSGERRPAFSWVNLTPECFPPEPAKLLDAIKRRYPHLTWTR